jgi:hypothetical protein
MVVVDENGWARGAVSALPPRQAWSLLSSHSGARIDRSAWAEQARAFFGARLEVVQDKRYPSGTLPLADAVDVDLAPLKGAGQATRVSIVTLPIDRAPEVKAAADAGVAAIGGAGFDVLVGRATRVWQVKNEVRPGKHPAAPLVAAAALASLFLAPIVPPNEEGIFGVKGARERLEKLGWRT